MLGAALQKAVSWLSPSRTRAGSSHLRSRRVTGFSTEHYDGAATTVHNRNHWAPAGPASALAANSLDIRKKLRERTRFEVGNNSVAEGIVDTLANDIIGIGPALVFQTRDPAWNRVANALFREWAKKSRFSEKLRLLIRDQTQSGEGFAILTSNPGHGHPVRLDLQTVECDRFSLPPSASLKWNEADLLTVATDGISFDKYGNPTYYNLLKNHPGDPLYTSDGDADRISASQVIHYFKRKRSGQVRGIPELTPSLGMFPDMRRYVNAVLGAAETGAAFSAVLESQSVIPGDDDEDTIPEMDLPHRSFPAVPKGHKLHQLQASQPVAEFDTFTLRLLAMMARCVHMPIGIAMGDSSMMNYASGRLDLQNYVSSIEVTQCLIEIIVLDVVLDAWLNEALLIPGLLPQYNPQAEKPVGEDGDPDDSKNSPEDDELQQISKLDATKSPVARLGPFLHEWHFRGRRHVDPQKEAAAQALMLDSCCTTLADEWASQGQDWEEKVSQRARENKILMASGLKFDMSKSPLFNQGNKTNDSGSGND